MFTQRTKNKTNALVVLFFSLGIIILLNIISVKKFARFDLTEDSIYTLSSASRDIMKNLDDPLIIKVYFSKNLPPPYNNIVRFLKDQLDEFKAYSQGRLKYEFIDPAGDEKIEREIMMLGIPPVQLTDIRSDKFEIIKGYMGMVILFEDRKEVLPLIKTTTGLEYDIVSRIKKVLMKEAKMVGFLTGHKEVDLSEDMKAVAAHLRERYEVLSVDLSEGKKIPDILETLIIAGPSESISEREKYEIDQFLMKGKTIAFLLDSFSVNMQTFQTTPVTNNLEDMLVHYGVTVNKDLILDLQNKRIQVQQQRGFMVISNIVNYPFIPVMRAMDKENQMVSKLEGAFFPFASSLTLHDAAGGTKTVTPLISSSEKSWVQSGARINTNPLQRYTFDTSKKGPYPVAAVVSGEFKSFYAGKEVPKADQSPGETGESSIQSVEEEIVNTIEKSPNTRIVVVGDSDFIKDALLMDQSNLPFIMNMIDWLVQDEALIAIRSRGVTDRPLEEISDFKKKLFKVINIFGISSIFIIFGLIRWKIRQLKKKEIWV